MSLRRLSLSTFVLFLLLPEPCARGAQEAPQWTEWWQAHRQDYLIPNRLVPEEGTEEDEGTGSRARVKIPKVEEANEFAKVQLDDPVPAVRLAAAFLLARTSGEKAIPELLERLEKDNNTIQQGLLLCIGLASAPESVKILEDVIKDGMYKRHRLSLHCPVFATVGLALAREHGLGAPADKAIERLLRQRKVDDEVVYGELVLAATSPTEALHQLCIDTVRDRQMPAWVRRRAASSLASFPGERSAKALFDTLGDASDIDMQRTVALALGAMPGPEAAKAMLKAYQQEGEVHLRAHLLISMGRNADVGTLDALLEAISGGSTALRDFAYIGLGLYTRDNEAERADEALIAALTDRGSAMSKEVLALACGLGRVEGAVTALAGLVASGESQAARGNAALALGLIGTTAAREQLLAAGGNQKGSQTLPEIVGGLGLIGDVRDGATLAGWVMGLAAVERRALAVQYLTLHGGLEVIDALVKIAGDQKEDGPVRAAALYGLGMLYEQGPRPLSGRAVAFQIPRTTPEWIQSLWSMSY